MFGNMNKLTITKNDVVFETGLLYITAVTYFDLIIMCNHFKVYSALHETHYSSSHP